jgi:hypothetical protein
LVVKVYATGTNLIDGTTFDAEWVVWVDPERGHESGLYGEW